MQFISVDLGWPGSMSDVMMWKNHMCGITNKTIFETMPKSWLIKVCAVVAYILIC
jgi:hypothetical protein